MADIFLRSVPSDADRDDVRLYQQAAELVASAENPASLPHLGIGATSVADALSSAENPASLPHLGIGATSVIGDSTLTAEFGTYSITGYDALAQYSLFASQGTYSLTGYDALAKYSLFAEQGTYSLSGQDANLFRAYSLPSDQGTYSITGYDALAAYSLFGDPGFYSITGQDASLLKSGDPAPEPAGNNNHPGWRYVYNKNQFVRRVGRDLVVYEYIEPDEEQTPLEKKVTVVKRGKPAIPVASVPIAMIKQDAKQYPDQEQKIMRMFQQQQFDQILAVYATMINLRNLDEEDEEMILLSL